MKIKKMLLLICCFMFLVGGCANVPSLVVQRPWTRTLNFDTIDNTKPIKIIISESSSPLTGSEYLVSQKAISFLGDLLKRRGFSINMDNYEYEVKLSYRTERNDKMNISAYSSTESTFFTTVSNLNANQILSYIHTISVEILTRDGTVLWEGKSYWETNELDLLQGITPTMQLILKDLPIDRTVRPEVQEVKDTHYKNYYLLNCKNVWFTCPALKYRILFEPINANYKIPEYNFEIPNKIKDRKALAAYVDLIQTAEYALPSGNESDWGNPLKESLWKNATLGGQYLIGSDKTPINVIVKLTGKDDGYYISECKIAEPDEIIRFNQKLKKWQEILSDYQDVYK